MSDHYDSDEDAEENIGDVDQYSGLKNVAIILIDIGPDMFDKTHTIKKCLVAVYQQMDKMLLKGYRRNISVCLLRDDDIVLTPLVDNIIDSCKKILELLQKPTSELQQMFERKSIPSLRYTLSECLKEMNQLSKVNPHIVILTNDDDPHKGDTQENLSALEVARSFKETNVKLVVLPLKEGFKYETFYGELLKTANDVPLHMIEQEDRIYDTVEDINEVLECIIKNKVSIKRMYFTLSSIEGKELGFWTQVRHLVKTNNLYANISLSRETKSQVKLEFEDEQLIDQDKLLVNIPPQENLVVMKTEKDLMHEQMPIGIRLLYLTKHKRTSMHYFHKRCLILQNDETNAELEYPKKKQLFDDMWHYCRQNNKYVICAYRETGKSQMPHYIEFAADVFEHKPCFVGQIFVELREKGEELSDDESDQAEDLKSESKKIPGNDRELGYFCEMIDKLKVKNFSPTKFPCYDHEIKAALIKSHLLDSEVNEVSDSLPTNEQVKEKLGDTYQKLADIFGKVDEPETKKSRKK